MALAIAVLVYHLKAVAEYGLAIKSAAGVARHVSFGIYLWHFRVMRAMVLIFLTHG